MHTFIFSAASDPFHADPEREALKGGPSKTPTLKAIGPSAPQSLPSAQPENLPPPKRDPEDA